MTYSFSDFSDALKAGARISAEDVLAVRREVWPDGSISEAEAEALFEINRLAGSADPAWADFFLEAICDHLLNSRPPRNYVDEAGAAWLIGHVDRGDDAADAVELELVVRLLERALNAPAALKAWALRRTEAAVLDDGRVGEDEAKILRRILFAAGGDGAATVSQDEAETLWRIKDATLGADNAPAWKILFVQGVGNHLMAFSSYRPLERDEARRLDAWAADHRSSVLGFIGRMRPGSSVAEALRAAFPREQSASAHEAAVDAARAVTPQEKGWLDGHVEGDGRRDPYEEALLAFVAEESARS
ncbi:MAG: hypothetical protein QOI38_1057 [Sphingomonadales bacterium]|jgi:hypothetical protein|nr:hypothetical protein [Sphingomonadales bacterium]